MACFYLFLSCERPELDRSWADNDILSDRFIPQRVQYIRSVWLAVMNRLDALVANDIPDFDYLVRANTNKMVSFFVKIDFNHGSVVTIQLN